MKPGKQSFFREAGLLGNVLSTGFTGGVCLAISLFIGYKIDQYYLCEPAGILAGIVIGLIAALVQTVKQLREGMGAFSREQIRTKEERTKEKNTPV